MISASLLILYMDMGKVTIRGRFLIAGILALAAAGCSEKDDGITKMGKYTEVQVMKPATAMVEIWDDYPARIEGQKSVEIRARVSGYLEKIRFTDGEYVKEGDILFEIDPRPFEALVDAAEADVSETEARIELAQNNMNRAEELLKSNAISKEVLETRRSDLFSAKAVLLSAQAKLREAKLNLEFTKIRSPISGYVSRRLVDEGNLVNASTTLLTSVVSRDVVYAYFEASERDIIKYATNNVFAGMDPIKHVGPPVRLKLLDEEKASHTGVLTYVDNTLNAASIEMRAEIDNPNGRLYPGMYATVSLRGGEPVERLLLPESAIGTDLVSRYILVADEEGNVIYRPVKVGDTIGKMQIILEGVSPDETVIVNGLQRAMQYKKVKPVEGDLHK